MKIVVLSCFPWLDRHGYRKRFLRALKEKPYATDVCLLYHKAALADTLREVMRMGVSESVAKWSRMRRAASPTDSAPCDPLETGTLSDVARRLHIPIKRFDALSSDACQTFLKAFAPDVMLNLSGQYIPASVLAAPKIGVVGAHYGLLPRFRGTDAPRWNILLDEPLTVCHMHLVEKMDRGDILLKQPVPVRAGDTYARIYKRCQELHGAGYLTILDRIAAGTLTRLPQKREEGNLFYRMGTPLRQKVDRLLEEKKYSHYLQTNASENGEA